MKLTGADVQEIIRLLDDSAYDEFEIETSWLKLVLRRGKSAQGGWSQERQTLTEPSVHAGVKPRSQESKKDPAATGIKDLGEGNSELTEIRAPVVGTFYRAPQPGAPPFVEPGSRVLPDSVIAVIEVMKLFNSVTAGVSGEVVDICVRDAEFVEQGQCLLRVKQDDA